MTTKPQTRKEAFKYLLTHPQVKKVGTLMGYYALGDAYQIASGMDCYRSEIVLVEFRHGLHQIFQYNCWGNRCKRQPQHPPATVFGNCDKRLWQSPQEKQADYKDSKIRDHKHEPI